MAHLTAAETMLPAYMTPTAPPPLSADRAQVRPGRTDDAAKQRDDLPSKGMSVE